jgi:RNase P/RNase MRP subunit POP5
MKEKKLKLKPSARDNRRYLIVEAENFRIEKALLEYLGVLGFAKTGYMKVSENGKTIASVRREELEKVRAALGMAGLKINRVSGTLKGLE